MQETWRYGKNGFLTFDSNNVVETVNLRFTASVRMALDPLSHYAHQ